MIPLVVVENPRRWPFDLEGAEVVSAREYLVDPRFAGRRGTAVFNVCRSYRYQSVGYYVSLLAAARGHRPLPSVATLQELTLTSVVRLAEEELAEVIRRSLAPIRSPEFDLSIYFGRNVAVRHDRLSRALFNLFPAPFLKARFVRADDRWTLASLRPIPASEVPEGHREFVIEQAQAHFARRSRPASRRQRYQYDLAILWDPDDPTRPSDQKAIRRFIRAAHQAGMSAEVIDRDDFGRLGEYDALFIRETTAVDHHTFRFATRAAADGLVVLDDPESIIRCGNKVFQAELFGRHRIPAPETLVLHAGNLDEVASTIGFPCVLKRPDGTFSQGVVRVDTPEELHERMEALLHESELVVAQEWMPSSFDWRIGVLDGIVLWAARYHMADGHWQIVQQVGSRRRYGRVEAVSLEEVPSAVAELAVRAANLIGRGLYGVDVKEIGGRVAVVEVNDNPNIDSELEDAVAGDALYDEVMGYFRARLDARGDVRR